MRVSNKLGDNQATAPQLLQTILSRSDCKASEPTDKIMAASIHPHPAHQNTVESETKMLLLNKLEGHQDIVNKAIVFDDEEGVLSVSDDK